MTGGRSPVRRTRGLLVVLLAAQLVGLPLLVVGAAPPPARAGLPNQDYPWGDPPSGMIAFAVPGEGIFAAERDCDALACVYRLTEGEWDRDPAWGPTGRVLYFEARECEACVPSIAWVDTDTGAVSRPQDASEQGLFTPAPGYDGVSVLVSVGQPGPCAIGSVPTRPTGMTSSSRERADRPPRGIAPTAMLGTGFCPARPQIGLVTIGRIVFDIEARMISTSENSRDTCGSNFASREAPRWSPTSDEIAFIRRDGCGTRVFVASSTDINGSERHIPTPLDWTSAGFMPDPSVPPPGPTGVDWSPDGSRLVVSGTAQDGECGHYVVPIAGGAPSPLFDFVLANPCGYKAHPRWAPDDELIAVEDKLVLPDGTAWHCVDDGLPCFSPPMAGGGGVTNPGNASGTAYDPQCTPGSCATFILVSKAAKDLSALHEPTSFTFTAEHAGGTSSGSLILVDDPFAMNPPVATLRVKPGDVTVRELPTPGWKPFAIECANPGARADVAAGSITLTVTDGSTTNCSFTNDPGDFALPTSGPTPTPSIPADCTRHETWTREWAARGWGIDMLMFRMSVPFCSSPTAVFLTGKIDISGVAAEFLIADLVSPIDFEWVKEDLDWAVKREASGALVVDASGRFNACSNIFEIIGYVAAPLRAAKTAARFLPEKVLRGTVDRVLEAVEEWLFRALKKIPGVTDQHILQYAPGLLSFFQRQFRPVKEAIMTYLLDPAADAGAEKYFSQFKDLFDFCVSTWSPVAQVRISPPTGQPIPVMIGDASPFWDIVDNGP